jgi:hypothetical protein
MGKGKVVGVGEFKGLYHPFGWSHINQGFIASFRLDLENRGLDPPSSCS